jgi:hypothetical protein
MATFNSVLQMLVQISGNGVSEVYNLTGANPVVNTASPGGGPILTSLVLGNNTLTVPPGCIGMIIIPPSNSTVAKAVKGITGDTGFSISPNLPSMLTLPTGTLTAIVNASGPEVVSILWL